MERPDRSEVSFGRSVLPAERAGTPGCARGGGYVSVGGRLVPSPERERERGRLSSMLRFSPVFDGAGDGAGELERELTLLVSEGRASEVLMATMLGVLLEESREKSWYIGAAGGNCVSAGRAAPRRGCGRDTRPRRWEKSQGPKFSTGEGRTAAEPVRQAGPLLFRYLSRPNELALGLYTASSGWIGGLSRIRPSHSPVQRSEGRPMSERKERASRESPLTVAISAPASPARR